MLSPHSIAHRMRRKRVNNTCLCIFLSLTLLFLSVERAGSESVPKENDKGRDVVSASRVNIIAVRPPSPDRVGYASTHGSLVGILDRLKQTHRGKVDIIVFPEMFMGTGNQISSTGANSSLIASLSDYAAYIHCYMVIPVLDKDEQGALYNSALFMNRQGQVFASYR